MATGNPKDSIKCEAFPQIFILESSAYENSKMTNIMIFEFRHSLSFMAPAPVHFCRHPEAGIFLCWLQS